jgi:hypothetical protein
MHAFDIHRRQLAPDEGMDPAVTVPRVLASDNVQSFRKL